MRLNVLIALLVPTLACTTATAPDRVRQLGVIAGFQQNDPNISVVRDGRTVDVSVTTYGGGCETQGETEVDVNGLDAVVTPYDYTAYTVASDAVCTQELRSFVHSTSIQFGSPGTARIVVRGIDRRNRTATNPRGDTLSVVRTVELP